MNRRRFVKLAAGAAAFSKIAPLLTTEAAPQVFYEAIIYEGTFSYADGKIIGDIEWVSYEPTADADEYARSITFTSKELGIE